MGGKAHKILSNSRTCLSAFFFHRGAGTKKKRKEKKDGDFFFQINLSCQHHLYYYYCFYPHFHFLSNKNNSILQWSLRTSKHFTRTSWYPTPKLKTSSHARRALTDDFMARLGRKTQTTTTTKSDFTFFFFLFFVLDHGCTR